MKEIIIARHAKSDWNQGLPDLERPLNKRGLHDAPAMGAMLSVSGFKPDRILSSPAHRAKTTAELVAKELGFRKEIIEDERIYFQGVVEILNLLRELPGSVDRVMVFGHNPTHEEFIGHMLGMAGGITLPTGGMACLVSYVEDWASLRPGNVALKWFVIPRLIRKDA